MIPIRSSPRTIRGLVTMVALISGLVTFFLTGALILVVHWELERQLDQRIEVETHTLLAFYREHGFSALAHVVALRDQRSGTGDTGYLAGVDEAGRSTAYALTDAGGRRVAGSLTAALPPPGWSEFVKFRRPDGSTGVAQAMNSALPNGGRLVVAADRSVINQMHWKMLKLFAVAYGTLLVLSLFITIGFGRAIGRRLAGIERSAEAIMAGDLTQRMPLDGSGGEFDRLALVLNRMLERMNVLLENLRQISGDIAHDLRTPLQHVRSLLEELAVSAESTPLQKQVEAAIGETDDLLELFSSLLAISEIEGQSVRSSSKPLDLYEVVENMVDIYRPTIESSGRTIDLHGASVPVHGDRKLLQRVVANLLDNAQLHTPDGTHIHIAVGRNGGNAVLTIEDDGPGIPPAERERVFQRLTRLDASRSTPGHGLGLNMVAAIAAAHDGSARIVPLQSGLAVEFTLPLAFADERVSLSP